MIGLLLIIEKTGISVIGIKHCYGLTQLRGWP